MRRIILVAALLGLAPQADAGLAKETLDKLERATVLVRGRSGGLYVTCTGFLIKVAGRAGYVVTSGEIVELSRPAPGAAPQLSVVLEAGTGRSQSARASVAAIEGLPENLTVLTFKAAAELPAPIDVRQDAAATVGMPVHILGYASDPDPSLKRRNDPAVAHIEGTVARVMPDSRGHWGAFQLDGGLNFGYIGSPILDDRGKLAGVLLGSIRNRRIGAAVGGRTLSTALRPQVGPVAFKTLKTGDRSVTVQVDAPVRDPLGELQSVSLLIVDDQNGHKTMERRPDGTYDAIEGGRRVEMNIQGKKAVGSWAADAIRIRDQAIGMHQVVQVETQGTFYGTPTTLFFASLARPSAGGPAPGAAPGRAKRGEPTRSAGGSVDEQRRYGGHTGAVTALAVARDGRHMVSSSLDQTIRYWDLESGETIHTLKGHDGPVISVDITPDGKRAVSGGADRTVRIWDLAAGTEIRRMAGHGGGVLDVAFSPDGGRILSAGSGAYREPKPGHEPAWHPEGDFSIRLWDAATGEEIHKLSGHTAMVWSVAFSRDGIRAVSGGDDATVRLWDLESGRELACDKHHTARVFCVGFATSNKDAVVSAGQDGLIWSRSLPGGGNERSVRFERSMNLAHLGAFAPDGRRVLIAMASWMPTQEGILYLWELNRSEARAGLHWGSGGNTRGTFFSDGSRVLWGSADGLIHLFRLAR